MKNIVSAAACGKFCLPPAARKQRARKRGGQNKVKTLNSMPLTPPSPTRPLFYTGNAPTTLYSNGNS